MIRPERSESGAYVIETSSTSDYTSPGRQKDLDYDDRRRLAERRDIDILSPPRRRDRSMSRGTFEAMREVRVTEDDSSDDGRRSTRSRRTLHGAETDMAVVAPPLVRHTSSMRHDHSPDSVKKRRSRSIGFIRDQINHHDASESKHERPGAEANVAGKYLIDHRGERTRRRDDEDDSAFEPYPLRKYKTEATDTYGVEVERRRREGRQKEVDYRYDEDDSSRRGGPYPPQKDRETVSKRRQ